MCRHRDKNCPHVVVTQWCQLQSGIDFRPKEVFAASSQFWLEEVALINETLVLRFFSQSVDWNSDSFGIVVER